MQVLIQKTFGRLAVTRYDAQRISSPRAYIRHVQKNLADGLCHRR
jgi:hypothetical protein